MIRRKKSRKVEEVDVAPKGFDDYELQLGDMMRGERATLGKSLLDVQRELKIKASYISAIENADPSVFETPGFIAGYVRSYARYLNMDPERAFDIFCRESGFSTAHGMSDEASSIKKSRAAEIIASSSIGRDPFAQPSTPFVPTNDAFMSRVEPGAIGSTLVLVTLLGAIGFGGWTVLNEVQQVRVAPVDETPIVLTDLDPIARATAPVVQSQDDVTAGLAAPSSDGLDRLYRPKALDTPVLVARDAPISMINPQSFGAFAAEQTQAAALEAQPTLLADGTVQVAPNGVAVPQVVEQIPGQVQLVAVRPAWVRVSAADGTSVFEGILNAGDTYPIPMTEDPATLRVGESGAIYFAVNGQHFGPAGPRGQVTSKVALSADALTQKYEVADISADQDLARVVAEVQGLQLPTE
ncbi:cytoskeletal protein RodZ [Planktotalea frisia]|jgi:cytoskeletal protein RodZ|uniref:Cytoskeleton protein RodZ n=1 Tax=Planktotalea frisia TaxID=696762 RepID=A0A1L9NRN8_9RHOB|nr:helix-turn-helix domain-containing protein [Planktotalea frisia]OJI91804.1 cytoskeleton protein RodZ [Planktotalea frisia]PZX21614.1 cytoskeletal protein RodZ [Planktotalea frisia]